MPEISKNISGNTACMQSKGKFSSKNYVKLIFGLEKVLKILSEERERLSESERHGVKPRSKTLTT